MKKFGKGETLPADILAFKELLDFLNLNEKLRDVAQANPLPDFINHLEERFSKYLLDSEVSQTNNGFVASLT